MNDPNKRNLVLLLHPGKVTNWLWEQNFPHMPFESLYLARFLESNGFEVAIIDQRVEEDWEARLRRLMDRILWVGLTIITGPQVGDALAASKAIREIDPDIPIVWGGWHPTFLSEQSVTHPLVDYVIAGIGETKALRLSQFLSQGDAEALNYEGILYKSGPTTYTSQKEKFEDLLEIPSYHLIDPNNYRSGNNMVGVITARGCPFRCSFCTIAQVAYINRPFDSVVDEVSYLINDLEFSEVNFVDGHFFAQCVRVFKMLKELRERRVEFKWRANARPETLGKLNNGEFDILLRSGLKQVMIGAESGSNVMLERIVKDANADHILETAKITAESGIDLSLSFMTGLPYETVDDLRATISVVEEVLRLNPTAKVINPIYQPIPGAPAYDQMVALGWKPPAMLEDWGNEISWNQKLDEVKPFPWMTAAEFDEFIEVFSRSLFGKVRQNHFTGQERRPDVSVSGLVDGGGSRVEIPSPDYSRRPWIKVVSVD